MTRFWEIFAGGGLAIFLEKKWLQKFNWTEKEIPKINIDIIKATLKIIGLILIIRTVFFQHPLETWPGDRALIPIIGAMLVVGIECKSKITSYIFRNRIFVFFGLISYPLYLYHWLFLSLFNIALSGQVTPVDKIICVIFSIALSYLTYRYIESPVRTKYYGSKYFVMLPAGMLLVFLLSLMTYSNDGWNGRYVAAMKYNDIPNNINYKMSNRSCLTRFGYLFPDDGARQRDFCRYEGKFKHDEIVIIGDSHASKLYQGFISIGFRNLIHIGRGSCAPIYNLDPIDNFYKCQPVVNNLINHFLKSNSKLIILAGVFGRYFDGTYSLKESDQEVRESVRKMFDVLGRSKKQILIVLDNPSLPFDPKECMIRPFNLRQREKCYFPRDWYDAKESFYKKLFLKYSGNFKNIRLIDSSQFVCDKKYCYAANRAGLLYTGDDNHLSIRGARMVDEQIIREYPGYFENY